MPKKKNRSPVHDEDDRHELAAFHHQLREGLHDEGSGVLQLAFQQHAHGVQVKLDCIHLSAPLYYKTLLVSTPEQESQRDENDEPYGL